MIPEIIVVGSSNMDMVIRTDHLPAPGETVIGGDFMIAPGGKGANQAVAAARGGGKVAFITKVGNDIFGKQLIEGFIKDKINTDYVYVDRTTPTGVALIMVDKNGENSIAVAPGANSKLTPDDIKAAEPLFKAAKTLLVQLEIPLDTVKTAIDMAYELDLTIILNPAPATKLPCDILKKVSIMTPNETEEHILTGLKITDDKSLAVAYRKLSRMGVKTVITTLGQNGAVLHSKHFSGIFPAFQVTPVDTTAAGDVFNGALAVAITEGMDLQKSIKFANAAAAISVTRIGAQPSAPLRAEIIKLLNSSESF